MELNPSVELDRRSLLNYPNVQQSRLPVERLSELSSWMLVLGTVRLVGMLADYAGAFFEAIRIEPFTIRTLYKLSEDFHPIVVVSAAWPLILAIALRRSRWPQLLPAAAATFLVLSIGGLIELTAQLGQARGYGGTVGSFHLTRRAFLHPSIPDLVLGTLGATQLLLELATAIRTILLIPRARGSAAEPTTRQEVARRARYGRLALYTSFGFLFVVIRLPVWSTYLELLNNSKLVRNFVLENDTDRSNWRRIHARGHVPLTESEKRINDYRVLISASDQDAQRGRYAEARDRYKKIIAAVDALPEDSLPSDGRPMLAEALNNLAWLQATCPEISIRNPVEAVVNARRATKIKPDEGNYWNTLGAAHFRADQWLEAKNALNRSMALRSQGDSFDWFFLSLVDLKLGQANDARRWYDKAVEWFERAAPHDSELYRFHVEAAEALGLSTPRPREITSSHGSITPSLPGSMRRMIRRKQAEGALRNARSPE
jgi:tetratricopeptide (TPR) repeat protein